MKAIRLVLILAAMMVIPATLFAQSTTRGGQRTVTTYQVDVSANIRNANVYVNGELQNSRTPASLMLTAGRYTIRIEARGYEPWEEDVVVDSNRTIRVTLRQPFATIILSIPGEYLNDDIRNPLSEIDFYVDGRLERGSRVQVRTGTHRIAIVSGGLKFESDVYFEAGMVYTLELILRLNLLQSVGAGR